MKAKIFFPLIIVILLGVLPMDLGLAQAWRCAHSTLACSAGQTPAQAYEQILRAEPWQATLWERLAEARLQTGDIPGAVEAFASALEKQVLSAEGQVRYGRTLLLVGEEEQALTMWLALAESGQTPPELLLSILPELHAELLGTLRLEEAERVREIWLLVQPQDAEVHWQAGLLGLLRSHAEALEEIAAAAALDPALTEQARALSGAVALASLETDAAYQQLIIGRELAKQGFPLHAEFLCAQAVQLAPGYAEAWAFLGELQQQNGRDGYPALQQALALAPESALVRSLFALYWQRADDPQKAVEVYTALAAEDPRASIWRVELANVTAQAGDIPAGLEILVQTAQDFPEDAGVNTALANYCASYRTELDTYGLTAARKALLLASDSMEAQLAMGNVLFSLQDYDSASRYYHRALAMDPTELSALYQLGVISQHRDVVDDGRYYFQQVLSLAPPNSEWARLAERMLEAD